MIYWITGKAGSGKSKKARNMMLRFDNAILLDSGELHKRLSIGFSDGERERLTMIIAHFGAILEEQGFTVFIAKMAGRKKWRQAARKLFKQSKLIYLAGGSVWPEVVYEKPDEEELG